MLALTEALTLLVYRKKIKKFIKHVKYNLILSNKSPAYVLFLIKEFN